MIAAKIHPKTCRQCGKMFVPARPLQSVCSPRCATRMAVVAEKEKKAKQRSMTKARKEELKTISDRIEEAQKAFNAYIRLRDKLACHTCISSGQPLNWWRGNAVDAGHYRSTGAAPHLRFDERNCHAQSKQQNRYLAGNAVDYRIRLIERIGLEEVEALEADNRTKKWTHAELIEIAAKYRAKLKALKKR